MTSAETLTPKSRQQTLQRLGIFCGFAAALWLAGAEAPTKLVTVAVSPLVISFMMVFGAFVSRWSLPAILSGTRETVSDARHVPHLILWGVMAGCLWAIGNTLTIFAVRDIGLSLAFPLWNANSLVGVVWGILLFKELHGASWFRKFGVIGGALIIFVGALFISAASTSQPGQGNALRGILAACGASLMFGSMYIPYRKAYISGMNPLTFLTFFTMGEIVTVTLVAMAFLGGVTPFLHELSLNRHILFWPFLGGFMWVIGDLFQNYATKYVGISRAIPLSNTNQLWGLLWAIFVFGELHGLTANIYLQVIGGSVLMAAGAVSIASCSASTTEYACWQEAAHREARLYNIAPEYVDARMQGRETEAQPVRRTAMDLVIILIATAITVGLAVMVHVPQMLINFPWLTVLTAAMIVVLVAGTIALWRVTRFN
jgi:glucose uptake protein GlcU